MDRAGSVKAALAVSGEWSVPGVSYHPPLTTTAGGKPVSHHGFVRVAAAAPQLRVADCSFNVGRILALLRRAEAEGAAVVVFPELSLTGYTCADLFQQLPLQAGATAALLRLAAESKDVFSGLAVVGLP